MGSFSAIRPSSTNMSAATEVIGFVIEAILKMVSRSTGNLRSISRQPKQAVRSRSVLPDQGCGSRKLPRIHDLLHKVTHNVCLL